MAGKSPQIQPPDSGIDSDSRATSDEDAVADTEDAENGQEVTEHAAVAEDESEEVDTSEPWNKYWLKCYVCGRDKIHSTYWSQSGNEQFYCCVNCYVKLRRWTCHTWAWKHYPTRDDYVKASPFAQWEYAINYTTKFLEKRDREQKEIEKTRAKKKRSTKEVGKKKGEPAKKRGRRGKVKHKTPAKTASQATSKKPAVSLKSRITDLEGAFGCMSQKFQELHQKYEELRQQVIGDRCVRAYAY